MTRLNPGYPQPVSVPGIPSGLPNQPVSTPAAGPAAPQPSASGTDQVQLSTQGGTASPIPTPNPALLAEGMDLRQFDQLFANSNHNLADFQKVLQARPDIRQHLQSLKHGPETVRLLEKAANQSLNSKEIKQIQTFLTESVGARIHYPGHASGIDGRYGSRTHSALEHWMRQQVARSSQVPTSPPTASLSGPQLQALLPVQRQSLTTVARVFAKLPAAARQKLAQMPSGEALIALLTTATQRPLNQTEIRTLQRALVAGGASLKYPGHATGVDGDYGQKTYQALRQVLLQSLENTPIQGGTPAEPALPQDGPYPRYDKMLADNLLDMTLALGYDEGSAHYAPSHLLEEQKLTREIEARGFQRNDARALELLAQAGKQVNAQYSAFYVKENIGEANGKPVHSIIRVLKSGDGLSGGVTRKAAVEGMNQSDVFMYGGHARYGTGPDFDRNFKITINWDGFPGARAKGTVTYTDYEELKHLLSPEDNDMKALEALRALQKAGRVTLEGSNQGNIRIGTENKHPYELGSHLMHEALAQTPAPSLSEEIQGEQYRLWLFNGCRTHDYQEPIRAMGRKNPALNSKNLDLIMTNQTLWWDATAQSLLTFMDGVMKFESARQLTQQLKQANPDQGQKGPTHVYQGFDDNPMSQPLRR